METTVKVCTTPFSRLPTVHTPISFSAFTQPLGSIAIRHLGDLCITVAVNRRSSVGFITVALFDTIVLVTISVRLVFYELTDSFRGHFRSFLKGHEIDSISRALLQTEKSYYLSDTPFIVYMSLLIRQQSVLHSLCQMSHPRTLGLQSISTTQDVFHPGRSIRLSNVTTTLLRSIRLRSGPNVTFVSIKVNSLDQERGDTFVESFELTQISGEGACVEHMPPVRKMSQARGGVSI